METEVLFLFPLRTHLKTHIASHKHTQYNLSEGRLPHCYRQCDVKTIPQSEILYFLSDSLELMTHRLRNKGLIENPIWIHCKL